MAAPYRVQRPYTDAPFRIIDSATGEVALDEAGRPIDGGGYFDEREAVAAMVKHNAAASGWDLETRNRIRGIASRPIDGEALRRLARSWRPGRLGVCAQCRNAEATRVTAVGGLCSACASDWEGHGDG